MEDVQNNGSKLMRFSSAGLPERERATILREVFGRGICNMEITPLTETPEVEAELRMLPGLTVTWGRNSPHRFEINRDLNRGSDDIVMGIFARQLRISHRGQQIDLDNGDATTLSAEQIASAECSSAFEHTTLRLQRNVLAHLLRNPEDVLLRRLPADSEALKLLRGYLGLLKETEAPLSAQAEHAVVTHIYDLVALAFGPARDVAEIALGRGVQAARLNAIKKHILSNLRDHRLSVQQVAAVQGVTTRYVQMLFEREGTTFSEFVLRERLAWTMRALSNPAASSRSISTIALDAGFGDLSYFNRVFRRSFGETPSDVRDRTIRAAHH